MVHLLESMNSSYLVLPFSNNLSFDSVIDDISDKVSKLSGFITTCTRGMCSYALLNLFKDLILPYTYYLLCHQRNHLDICYRKCSEKLLALCSSGNSRMLMLGHLIPTDLLVQI